MHSMYYNKPLLTLLAVFMFLPVALFAQVSSTPLVTAYTFTRHLKVGMTGADVLTLQKVLNADPDTRLASFGPGSPGNETNYFGPITKAAVVKYQDKHAAEVLHPLGLYKGTGYFGNSTIQKMKNAQQTSASGCPDDIRYCSFGPPVKRVPPSCEFTPCPTAEQAGKEVAAPQESAVPVIISRISKKVFQDGSRITLYGSGFDKTGNTVRSLYNIVTGLPSPDGKSITFTFESPFESYDLDEIDISDEDEELPVGAIEVPYEDYFKGNDTTQTIPVKFFVINSNGESNDISGDFEYQLGY